MDFKHCRGTIKLSAGVANVSFPSEPGGSTYEAIIKESDRRYRADPLSFAIARAKRAREWIEDQAEVAASLEPPRVPRVRKGRTRDWIVESPHLPYLELHVKSATDARSAKGFLRSLSDEKKLWLVHHLMACMERVDEQAFHRSRGRLPRGVQAGRERMGYLKIVATQVYLWLEHVEIFRPASRMDTQRIATVLLVALESLLKPFGIGMAKLDSNDRLVCSTAFLMVLGFASEWKAMRLKDPFKAPFSPQTFYRTWIKPNEVRLREHFRRRPELLNIKTNPLLQETVHPFILNVAGDPSGS